MDYGWEKFIRKKTEGKLCHRYCKKGARAHARPLLSLHNCAASPALLTMLARRRVDREITNVRARGSAGI